MGEGAGPVWAPIRPAADGPRDRSGGPSRLVLLVRSGLVLGREHRFPFGAGDPGLDEFAILRRQVPEDLLNDFAALPSRELFAVNGEIERVDLARDHRDTGDLHGAGLSEPKRGEQPARLAKCP